MMLENSGSPATSPSASPSTKPSARARDVLSRPFERIAHDRVLLALAVLLAAGLALRVWFTLVWSPAITGYSDSGIYFEDSVESIWTDPIRTQGYTMFLRVLHAISPHLLFVTIVQHGMGLIAAVLIFLAVRRCGGPRWLGLVPAAMVALGGDELFIEHAALSDALFTFLIIAMLYSAIRALDGRAWWAALTGLLTALIVWDRSAGLAMLAVAPLWLLFSVGRPTRRTLALGALSLVVSLAVVGAYIEWRESESGLSGLTTNSAWNLYGRVAPWADCSKFTPPTGTGGLCEAVPVRFRAQHTAGGYIYNSESPGQRLFGVPFVVSSYPHAMELMQKWSEAAIFGQPLEYLHAVWLDTVRLFDSNASSYGDLSANRVIAFFLYGPDEHSGKNEFVEVWQGRLYPGDPPPHHGDIAPLKAWEEITRVDGVWMGILLALCLAGPWVLRGRPRAGMVLFAITAVEVLWFPILVSSYDYRYVIPAFPPLVAAGALAAWGLALRLKAAKPWIAGRLGLPGPGAGGGGQPDGASLPSGRGAASAGG